MLIDTHAHLDEQAFEHDLDAVLDRAAAQGIEAIISIGVTAASSQAAVRLAHKYPQAYAVVGIQPNYVASAGPDDFEQIVSLASDPRVVGIGETGLDRYWDYAPLDLQQDFFRRHIELSRAVGKPFVVHCREAEADVAALLTEESSRGPLRGVMHSYSGDLQTAQACLALGMHVSFAGMLTFKSNEALRDVAKAVPLDRLLVETDSPYLAPTPLRGKRNEPGNVIHTARQLAELHGVSLEELARRTTENARRLFQLPTEP
jgi:TatD DNase family protein